MERLAQSLTRAGGERRISQAAFDRLHRDFVARDAAGHAWTFGLRERRWRSSDGRDWRPASPPKRLSMAQDTLGELARLDADRTPPAKPPPEPTAAQAPAPPSVGDLARLAGGWLSKNLVEAVVFAIFGASMGFILRWLAPIIDVDFLSRLAGGGDGDGQPGLMLPVFTAVLFALIGYWRSAGAKKLLAALASFPASIGSLIRKDGRSARIHILWGAGAAFLVSVAISPAIGALVGVAIALTLPSMLGGIISSLLFRMWSTLARAVSPVKRAPLDGAVMFAIGLLGSVIALLLGAVLDQGPVSLMLALACLGFAAGMGSASKTSGPGGPSPEIPPGPGR